VLIRLTLCATALIAIAGRCSFTRAESGKVEIYVNNTASASDDYVTWAPTPCRARVSPLHRVDKDLEVVLTNDAKDSAREVALPPGGDVSFALSVAQGQTAEDEELLLTLPKDGSWVSFVIAGRFPAGAKVGRASSRDKDTVIEVHLGAKDGLVIDRHRLMVRVRKDLRSLTDHERYRLLSGIREVHRRGVYEKFVEVHDWAARGDRFHIGRINHPRYSYPDAAHRASNFLPWHRIDLLQFEREVQKTHPDVALHYWRMDAVDPGGQVFSPDFFGSNEVHIDPQFPNRVPLLNNAPYTDFVKFSIDNPLHGWRITYQGRFANSELLTRWPVDRTRRPWRFSNDATVPPLHGEAELLEDPTYLGLHSATEGPVHNPAHNWFGPPMRDCTVAPSDPVFWSFHSWFDRVWAKWQWKWDRFDTTGSSEDTYAPTGPFKPSKTGPGKGHFLEDTMWPWDGDAGEGTNVDPDIRYFSSRPPVAPIGPFPESTIAGLWPERAGKPKVADAIDYLGISKGRFSHGYCYDDVPYGVAPPDVKKRLLAEDVARGATRKDAIGTFLDEDSPANKRVEAGHSITIVRDRTDRDKILSLVKGTADARLRSIGFRILVDSDSQKDALKAGIESLTTEAEAPAVFQLTVIDTLHGLVHFAPKGAVSFEEFEHALRMAIKLNRDASVRSAALKSLAEREDAAAVDLLRRALKDKDNSNISEAAAAQILALGGGSREHGTLLRPLLSSPDIRLTKSLMMHLSTEAESRKKIVSIAENTSVPSSVRIVALHALANDEQYPDLALAIISDIGASFELKRESLALLQARLPQLDPKRALEVRLVLQDLLTTSSPRLREAILRAANAGREEP
jgi:hypothetical protein